MQKPKTYMLRLYPDRAADKILINYLKSENNIQQYLRRLIEQDIRKENVEVTIRRAIEEAFVNIFKDKEIRVLSGGSISISGDEVPETFTFNQEEKKQSDISDFKEEIPETEIQNPDSEAEENEEQEESVEQITQDALAFLAGLE